MKANTREKLMMISLIVAGVLVVVAAIGIPSREARELKKVQRTQARLLDLLFRICVPLPAKNQFDIPGYKSLQCFYRQKKDGSLELVTDLNMPVQIPKPVSGE